MQNPWGMVVAAIGLLMFIGGFTKSKFILYRVLAARSRGFWGDHVHSFYVVVGLLMMLFGVLVALGIIHR